MNSCPQGFICVNNFHIIYITIISLMILYGFRNQYYKDIYDKLKHNELKTNSQSTSVQPLDFELQPQVQQPQVQQSQVQQPQVLQHDILPQEITINNRDRDLAVINDPLYPPLQRNYNVPNVKLMPINIETRESGGDYQQIGMLHKKENIDKAIDKPGNNDDSVILGLYGKPTYRGSNRWLYYVISEKNSIKIPLKIEDVNCTSDNRGCKELMDGDTINVSQYNGEFQVNIYKFDAPRYIPYV
jgi:hypothetical protein